MLGQLLHGSVGEETYLNVFHTMFISCSRKKEAVYGPFRVQQITASMVTARHITADLPF